MLTKDLLRYRTRKDKIHPSLINVQDPDFLEAAQLLLDVFEASMGLSRQELLDEAKQIHDLRPSQAVITRGFEKLLLDRTEFLSAPNETLINQRQEVFDVTAQLLKNRSWESLEAYQKALGEELKLDHHQLQEQIYNDLPPYQPVVSFKKMLPENLLHRYNLAQVQGLLLRCQELKLRIPNQSTPQLRQLFKYLRFHQLLAEVRPASGGHRDQFEIRIDGPLSLFFQAQKYGLQLAVFFPAVLHQPSWELEAEIHMARGRAHTLELDDSDGLRSHYRNFLAYQPPEFEVFQQLLAEKQSEWKVEAAQSFLPLPGDSYCFPDFCFTHQDGSRIALELFHPWHASHLKRRLNQLRQSGFEKPTSRKKSGRTKSNSQAKSNTSNRTISQQVTADASLPMDDRQPTKLMLGVSRRITKDPENKAAVEGSDFFAECGFLFRDQPTVDQVLKTLERVQAGSLTFG